MSAYLFVCLQLQHNHNNDNKDLKQKKTKAMQYCPTLQNAMRMNILIHHLWSTKVLAEGLINEENFLLIMNVFSIKPRGYYGPIPTRHTWESKSVCGHVI